MPRLLRPHAYTVGVARLLRAMGAARKTPGRVPRQTQPDAIRASYATALQRLVVAPMVRSTDEAKLIAIRGLRALRASQAAHADADDEAHVRLLISRAAQHAKKLLEPSELRAVAERFGRATSAFQKEQLDREVRSAIGVGFADIEKPARDIIPEFVAENVDLIKTVPERYFDRIEREVAEAYAGGMRPETLVERLMEIDDMAENDARRIARDQIGKLNAQFNEERQKGMGVDSYIWRTARDNRVRDEHTEREGRLFRWDSPPEDGHPGEPIQCFPGETRVRLLDARVEKAYRRRSLTTLVTLTTATGEELRATSNHPVLTGRGWLAAHLVEVGDHVFRARLQRDEFAVPNPQRTDAPIEQVFGALAPLGLVHRVPGLGGRFHGDAAVDEEVDVVDVDGLLSDELDPAFSERLCQDLLTRADQSTLRVGEPYLELLGAGLSSDRFVRGGNKMLALLAVELGLPEEHSDGAVAHLHSVALELAANSSPRDAQILRKLLDAGAAQVHRRKGVAGVIASIVRRAVVKPPRLDAPSAQQLGEAVALAQAEAQLARGLGDGAALLQQPLSVVKKSVGKFHGQVYNLTTSSGWYVAQNLIVHNCRCFAEPAFAGITQELDE